MILKEKNTWILGTALFLGYCITSIISPVSDFELDIFQKIILLGLLYGASISLVAIIKWNDRML